MDHFSKFLKEVIPPIIWRRFGFWYKYIYLKGWQKSGEKDARWYDRAFRVRGFIRRHYTESTHFFVFSIIADRIRNSNIRSVLDIGCGTGQIAALLYDRGLEKYVGFDFSEKRIFHARIMCPEYRFEIANAFETDLYEIIDYDAIICNEFLEHIENDVDVIKKIPSGKKFYGVVPNYSLPNHVRYFKCCEDVYLRYEFLFKKLRVDPLLRNSKKDVFFLMEGVVK